jgi:ribose 5-phosphate isomerase B
VTTIAVGADHAGFTLKQLLADRLRGLGHEVLDLGTHSEERVDYPDFAAAVGRSVAAGEVELGLLVCGSGIGVAIAANKVPGIRAATVHDVTSAHLSREHNDANVMCVGSRLTGEEVALEALDAFLSADFEQGRHTGRVAKIDALLPRS